MCSMSLSCKSIGLFPFAGSDPSDRPEGPECCRAQLWARQLHVHHLPRRSRRLGPGPGQFACVCTYCVCAVYVFACAQAIPCTKYTFIHINKLRSYVGIFLILILYLGVAAAKPVRREIQDQPAVEEGIQRLVKINNITGDTRPFISDSSPQLFWGLWMRSDKENPVIRNQFVKLKFIQIATKTKEN